MRIDPFALFILLGCGAIAVMLIGWGLVPIVGDVQGGGLWLALIGGACSVFGMALLVWVINEFRKWIRGNY